MTAAVDEPAAGLGSVEDSPVVDRRRADLGTGDGLATVWWQRPLLIALALFAVYLGIAQFTDPGGYLSTDTGGKTATLEAMTERGDLDPDLGYWAADLDPDGSLYPMYSTKQFASDEVDGEVRWVNVTTLPMIYLALPLYQQWGYDGALLIPMLGSVLAALAAGALATRVGGSQQDKAIATWVVGLAGPVLIYALDFWEHSVGLALMTWGVILATDLVNPSGEPRSAGLMRANLAKALLAGAAFGLASSMRQEALVYGFVTGLALVAMLFLARRMKDAVILGGSMVAGTIALIVANSALETAVLGASSRTSRSTDTALGLGSELGLRLEEALITGAMPFGVGTTGGIATALLLLVGLVALAVALRDGGNLRIGGAIVGALYLLLVVDMISGRSFVPGMAAVAPLSVVGAVLAWGRRDARLPYVVATVSLPLVWMVQYTGGAGPQWGGRYILTSGLLLTVLGIVGLRSWSLKAETPDRAIALRLLVAASVVVAAVGALWTVERTNGFGSAMREVAADAGQQPDETIMVFADPFMSREAGPLVLQGRWLAAYTQDHIVEVSALVTATGDQSFRYVNYERAEVPSFPGYVAVGERYVEVLPGYNIRLTTFEAEIS